MRIGRFLILLTLAACSATKPPVFTNGRISDTAVFRFSEDLVRWWGARSTRAEVFGVGAGITLDALTTGALATSGGGASPAISRGLVAGVNFIASLIRRIDPAARDNAFNEGTGIVLKAQSAYLRCITRAGLTVPPDDAVTECGAEFLARTNSAISIVGALMAGLLPQKTDLDNVGK